MNVTQISNITDRFGAARWVPGNLGDLPCEGWFLLEVNPLPPGDELHMVVEDIMSGQPIIVEDGQVRHLASCNVDHSSLGSLEGMQTAIQKLKNNRFKVAVHPGLGTAYDRQPLAVVLEPWINYEVFPDHPHLNTGGFVVYLGDQVYVPDTICYEENISGLGSDSLERFTQAFALLSVWLLRHMIWEETRKLNNGCGVWIGPQAASLTLKQRAETGVWNPSGMCRCGSGKRYGNCHMLSDLGHSALSKSMSEHAIKQCITARYKTRMEQHHKFYGSLGRSLPPASLTVF